MEWAALTGGLMKSLSSKEASLHPTPAAASLFLPFVFVFCVRCYVFSCLSLCSSFFGFRLFRSARFIFVYSFLRMGKFSFLFFF